MKTTKMLVFKLNSQIVIIYEKLLDDGSWWEYATDYTEFMKVYNSGYYDAFYCYVTQNGTSEMTTGAKEHAERLNELHKFGKYIGWYIADKDDQMPEIHKQ